MPDGQRDFVALFVAFDEETFSTAQQINWVSMPSGNDSAVEALSFFSEHRREDAGLIQLRGDARKFILHDIQPGDGPAGPQLVVSPFPKRRDFLHRMNQQDQSNEAFSSIRNLEAKDCLVHRLPTALSLFALFVPPLLHRHEVYMLAEHLRTTILAPVSIESTHLGTLVQALTASSANEDEDYQRLEFFGDCILKFFTSINLMASNLNWPEGYLTAKKGRITSNGFLARATMALGLERFIITKPFTGAKWKPRYERDVRSDEAQNADEEIFRSSKLIADVIESLIGASWVIGGLPKALLCLRTLLSTEDWKPVAESQEVLYEATPEEPSPQHLAVVESIVGYTFTKKHLMLEALTHASFKGPREVASSSYQRLEFLGDAILDYIVVKRLFAETPSLPFAKMHTVRTAMVNAAFLAFLSFENTVPEEQISIVFDPIRNECIPAEPVIVHRVLWQFLRQSPPGPKTQAASLERHRTYREQIIRALNEEARYPWHLLARTDAEKVFSDMVESMIGAIYIDSHGDLAACEGYIKKLGIMDCLERILRDGVDCLHPKEKLGHLAVSDSVEYTIVKVKDAGEHFCQVKVGGREIGGVVGGMRRLNAETEAAWEAVKIIEAEQDSIMQDSDVDGGVALQETDGSDSEYEDANEEMEDD
jgi:dsRNA-specific ribonuclease